MSLLYGRSPLGVYYRSPLGVRMNFDPENPPWSVSTTLYKRQASHGHVTDGPYRPTGGSHGFYNTSGESESDLAAAYDPVSEQAELQFQAAVWENTGTLPPSSLPAQLFPLSSKFGGRRAIRSWVDPDVYAYGGDIGVTKVGWKVTTGIVSSVYPVTVKTAWSVTELVSQTGSTGSESPIDSGMIEHVFETGTPGVAQYLETVIPLPDILEEAWPAPAYPVPFDGPPPAPFTYPEEVFNISITHIPYILSRVVVYDGNEYP